MIKKVFSFFGINKEILYTSSNSIIGALGSVITSILIINYLTINEQGFYYTFGSLIAIQVFFELGLNGILVQFVAHEVSHLYQDGNGLLIGDMRYKSRLSSLLNFSLKWYLCFSILLFVGLIIIGLVFFNKYGVRNENVNWLGPWIILVMGSAINLLASPLTAFIQGLGRVKEIAKFQLFVQIIRIFIIWFGLFCGAKLVVLGLSNLLTALVFLGLVILNFRKLLSDIWKTEVFEKISYLKEIFPLQWKIALSWMSGYLISQLFNPILFATEGPSVAGQMGLTLSALNGITSISIAWLTTKIPVFSGLIAKKKFDELDHIFNKTLIQSTLINILLVSVFVFVVFMLSSNEVSFNSKLIAKRFLDFWPLICMAIPVFINHIVAGWAIYLRSHNQEPFLVFSIVCGLACVLSILFLGNKYGLNGLSMGYLLVIVLTFPWAYYIFKSKRIEWH